MSKSLDIVCTCYDVNEFKIQNEFYNKMKLNLDYKIHLITNCISESDVKKVSVEINKDIHHCKYSNFNKHIGAFELASYANHNNLISKDYVLHYHADVHFRDINIIEALLNEFVESNKKIAGIPRQWMYDDMLNLIDTKVSPIKTEFFIMTKTLYKSIFDIDVLDKLKRICIENGLGINGSHFEGILYSGFELNNIKIPDEIYYLENLGELKKYFGNLVFYYNILLKKTGIVRYNSFGYK